MFKSFSELCSLNSSLLTLFLYFAIFSFRITVWKVLFKNSSDGLFTIESRVPFLISLFNFQGPIAILKTSLSKTAQRVYHTLLPLSILFWKFFQKSFLTFFLSLPSGLPSRKLAYNITSLSLCQQFFATFFNFSQFSHCFCTRSRVHLMFFTKMDTIYSASCSIILSTTIYRVGFYMQI